MRGRSVTIAIACFALAALSSGPAAAQACSVSGLEGAEARVQRDGSWHPLAAGPIAAGARMVETGPEARLELQCPGGVIVTIGPDSRVDLGALLEGPERSVFMQLFGGIMGLVAPHRDEGLLAVQTPVAIASVRSTEWLIEHDGTSTAVFVRAGHVAVANDHEEFVLGPGEGVTLGRDEVIKPVGEWGPARIRQVNEALGFGWARPPG